MPKLLPLGAYAEPIDLYSPFTSSGRMDDDGRPSAMTAIANWLLLEARKTWPPGINSPAQIRDLIAALLTVRPPGPLPADVHALLDGLLAFEAAATDTIGVEQIVDGREPTVVGPTIGDTLTRVWQGDIRRLAVDAIVNAANAQMLGCFRPRHRCIDNVIHNAAGPRMRDDCQKIVSAQGRDEATGDAKITRAYHLPARFVLHTVGPIVPSGLVQRHHSQALAECYVSCLDLAAEVTSIRSVAFCGVSTGVFGYPRDAAAEVALRAVSQWLATHAGRLDLIVFNVFAAEDRIAYERALMSSAHGAKP